MMILFDMDGTLVDVSGSYRQAIIDTVACLSGQVVTTNRIQGYKDLGGFNNDWQLSHSILTDMGFAVPYPQVIDTFQRIYWGQGENPDGLIWQERWLLKEEILHHLTDGHRLGIVTGRPRREALWTLDHFNMRRFFKCVIGHEDCPDGRGKPDPYGLQLAMKDLKAERGIYVGDTVDDQRAAHAAGLDFIRVMPPRDIAQFPPYTDGQKVLSDINDIMEVLS